jgi:transcriptional regulator with XRE-family HTH domain
MPSHSSASKAFGEKLQFLRKAQGLTQIDLSRLSALSKSYVSFLETGIRHPSREVVIKLAEVLGSDSQPEIREELLQLAGFTLENPANLKTSFSQSKSVRKDFHSFLHYTLQLIRQGAYERAQHNIEQSFQRFQKPAQMQTLLAHLELAQHHFEQAILLQKTALQHAHLSALEQEPGLTEIDLILNLGVMFFLWGDQALFAQPPDPETAYQRYLEALQEFKKGLEKAPDHLYLLDETGRVHFNLADLDASPEPNIHWQGCIEYFRAVLSHPNKQQLPADILRESAAFLALAYCKTKQFAIAGLVLDILSLNGGGDWLLQYIQACYYSLYSQQDADPQYLERGMNHLKQAIILNPAAAQQAQRDRHKDLAFLAKGHAQEFEEVLQCE